MLTIADVAKLKCNFVKKVTNYLECLTYSLDCCLDDAQEAFLNAKLASFTDCSIPASESCRLSELKITDYTVDCDASPSPVPCEDQATLSVSSEDSTTYYTTSLANSSDGSAYAYYELTPDSTTQTAKIHLLVTDAPSINLASGTFSVPSPYTLLTDTTLTSTADKAYTNLQIPGVQSLNASYISTIRFHYTNTSGLYVGDYVDIDVSPTSTYLTGIYTVTAAHLYFSHANWATAIQQVVENAIDDLFGSTAYINFSAYKDTSGVKISTRVKHAPASRWIGLKKSGGQLTYYNQLKGVTGTISNVFPTTDIGSFASSTTNTTVLCGTHTVGIASMLVFPASWQTSVIDFNLRALAPSYSYQTIPYTVSGNVQCTVRSIIATATTLHDFTLRWYDPGDNSIGVSTTSPLEVEVGSTTGIHTAELTLDSGCIISDTLTL